MNQNEDSFLCMLGEHTPTKDLTGFDHDMMNGEGIKSLHLTFFFQDCS